jgi:hypothetical protein
MRQDQENRVLGRQGARELTAEQVKRAKSIGLPPGTVHTNVITLNPFTLCFDGDGR